MTQDKKLDRKDFLTSAVAAWAAASLGACSDEGDGGGTDDGGSATGGSATGGSATGGSATGGSATGGSATGGSATGGSATGGMAGGGAGGMNGGSGGGGGGMYTCTVNRMPVSSGTEHSHPLMIPGSDIDRGYQDMPYPLEDGGTGHTHTLEFAPYEWPYLRGGTEIDAPSSEDAGHFHTVWVSCVFD